MTHIEALRRALHLIDYLWAELKRARKELEDRRREPAPEPLAVPESMVAATTSYPPSVNVSTVDYDKFVKCGETWTYPDSGIYKADPNHPNFPPVFDSFRHQPWVSSQTGGET